MVEILIGSNESGQRLDKFLRKYLSDAPLGLIYKGIRKKQFRVNGKRVEAGYILQEGDRLQLYIRKKEFIQPNSLEVFQLVKKNFDVIYEDENLLLVNKKRGTLIHADKRGKKDDLLSQVQSYLHEKGEYVPEKETTFAPAVCNRLDRNTGGIIVVAKNFPVLQTVNELFRQRKIKKYYYALVAGKMEKKAGVLEGYLLKDQKEKIATISSKDISEAKLAILEYRVLKENSAVSLLEICLITGRFHQIRAQFAAIGHPLIGDPKYGDKKVNRAFYQKYGLEYQFLYAVKFVFMEAERRISYLKNRTFCAPLPRELQQIIDDQFAMD